LVLLQNPLFSGAPSSRLENAISLIFESAAWRVLIRGQGDLMVAPKVRIGFSANQQ
jgi:hypothetical protein